MMRVSVVVPTCGRPELLDRCLAALASQEFDPAAYEVLVVDDAASDETRRQVCGWAQQSAVLIRYLAAEGTQGPAAARNLGWRAARAPLIAFTDDDCQPSAQWLSAGERAVAEGADAVCGRLVMPRLPPLTDYQRDAARLEEAGFVTANCFCRRTALEAVGGFDERFTAAWREDSDLYFSLLNSGLTVVRADDALVVHPLRPAAWGVSIWQQRKSMFNALLYKKHPERYRREIQSGPPWHYYGIAASAAAAALAAALGHGLLAGALLVIWLALTARFCWRRLRGTCRTPSHLLEMAITSLAIPWLAIFWRLRGAVKYRVLFF